MKSLCSRKPYLPWLAQRKMLNHRGALCFSDFDQARPFNMEPVTAHPNQIIVFHGKEYIP